MNAESIVAVSAAVVVLTQMLKWSGAVQDSYGPLVVIVLSALGVAVWLVSGDVWPPARTDAWSIFAGWISVSANAAGIYGFTRAAASSLTRATPPPPSGAGSERTVS